MPEFKGIYKRTGSDIYQTSIKHFDKSTGKPKWKYVSTRTSHPLKALKAREELQALEDLAGLGDSTLTRERAFETVNNLLRWHGIPDIEDDQQDVITIKVFIDRWLDDIKRTGSLSSYRAYSSHTKSFLSFIGEDVRIAAVSRRHIQDWYNELIDEERKASTVNGYLKSIRRVLRDAEEEGYITRSPAKGVKTVQGASRPKDPFTASDIAEILKGVTGLEHSDEWRTAVLFGLCLGARINDCSIRRWDEIDLGDSPHVEYMPEKTERKKVKVKAPLVNPLLSALRDLKKDSSGFVTPALAKIPASGKFSLSRTFSQLVRDLDVEIRYEEGKGKGIDWYSKSFHSFRHTLPSLMAAANVPEQIRMGIVGHTKLETHLGYTHHDDEQMRGALESSLEGFGGI